MNDDTLRAEDYPTITAEEALTLGSFSEHRKTALTRISDFTVPPGVPYQTPEGLRAEDEETRIAFDVQGGVYPIRESVFRASYEPGAVREDGPGGLSTSSRQRISQRSRSRLPLSPLASTTQTARRTDSVPRGRTP